MEIKQSWMDYLITDEDGYWCGISDNAPEEEKKKYQQYVTEQEQIIKEGKQIPR